MSLTIGSPHDTKNFEIALLFLLKPKIRRRGIKETQNAIPVAKTYEKGLPETEEQLLRRSLFGPSLGAVDSPGMNRLFKSTLELAYPQRGEPSSIQGICYYGVLTSILALDRSMRKAKDQGTDIEHCFEGLPRNMPIRDANTRSDKSSSSHRNRMAFTTGISIANTSADRSRVSSLSSMEGNEPNDRPPHELLTLAVDVVDPPVPNIPPKTKTFHGELPKLSGIGDIDAVLARRGESPDRPQVPCDRPSRVQHGPTERDAVSGHHKQPASVSLKYLHILERMSTPQKPDPGTRWPGSAEDVSSGPIAASPKPIETDMNPVTMPKCS